MSVLLVSPKDKGNTYDVLRFIKNNSDAELLVIGQNKICNLKKYETIIICSGVYGGNLHKNLRRWLVQLDKSSMYENVKIYVFLTWIGRGRSDETSIRKVKHILEKNDIDLEDDYITCFGEMAKIRYNHPNKEDCQKVLNWVKSKNEFK